jgi:hypothetical protein
MEEVTNTASKAYDVASALLTAKEEGMGSAKIRSNSLEVDEIDGDTFLKNLSKPTLVDGKLCHSKRTSSKETHNDRDC